MDAAEPARTQDGNQSPRVTININSQSNNHIHVVDGDLIEVNVRLYGRCGGNVAVTEGTDEESVESRRIAVTLAPRDRDEVLR